MRPNAMTPATVPTRRAFSERMAEYGSIDRYLEVAAGLDSERRERLREVLLA